MEGWRISKINFAAVYGADEWNKKPEELSNIIEGKSNDQYFKESIKQINIFKKIDNYLSS